MAFDFDGVVAGRVWCFGDSIDTDVIYPYYRYPSEAEVRKHTMEAVNPEFPLQVKEGDLLVAGRNFGCGSSRPGNILFDVGIAAVVAESFSRLFFRNCVSQGLPLFVAPGISTLVKTGDTLEIDYPNGRLVNRGTGKQLPLQTYPPMVEGIYQAGGILQLAKRRYDEERAAGQR
ncbi:3-isopropylmalate dehydratase small subunit [Pigmentiphaga soli]|uniref:3-isopropylmalate dehydratase small subunit n=1 Tax=Pigmentiphaga soli TaxID=1007095 RepID=A0ABP8GQI7_9BURK